MKKYLIIISICLAGLLMASCNKEKPVENKVTFGDYTENVQVGIVGYSDMVHHVNGAGYHLDLDATINGVSCHFFISLSSSCKGKTIDLGKYDSGVVYHFEINSSAEDGYPFDIHHYNDKNFTDGAIGHSSVGTWFKSGKMTLKDDGKTITFHTSGTTQDGRKFQLDVASESKKFE